MCGLTRTFGLFLCSCARPPQLPTRPGPLRPDGQPAADLLEDLGGIPPAPGASCSRPGKSSATGAGSPIGVSGVEVGENRVA
jgi:hypothetical protein